MALDFPANPAISDVYTNASAARSWQWDGESWNFLATTPASGETVVRTFNGAPYWWNGTTWELLAADASFANVSVLIRGDSFGVNSFADLSGNGTHARPTTSGAAAGSALNASGKFGGPCVASNSNTQGMGLRTSVVTPMLGAGDSTTEGWFYFTTNGINRVLFDFRPTDTVTPGPFLLVSTGNVLRYLSTGASFDITGATTLALNAWHHIHMTQASGTVYLGLDGAQEGSDLIETNDFSAARNLIVGQQSVNIAAGQIVGRFEHVRVSRVARYARTYTVPTKPFADY